MKILQNQLTFHLGEAEEIYEGYGTLPSAYPYRQYNTYSRTLKSTDVHTAVLENDYIKAVFLPDFGGRLWSLTIKQPGKSPLYNDVIRFSNLSTRNAWFSGGVEWNMGIIGHSPLSNDPFLLLPVLPIPVSRFFECTNTNESAKQNIKWISGWKKRAGL